MFCLLTVVKSDKFTSVTSVLSLDIPSSELIIIWQISNDCFFVPFTVTRCLDSCPIGFKFSFSAASLDMKSLPAPVFKCAQKVLSCTFNGTMACNVFSSTAWGCFVYPVDPVRLACFFLSQRLV